VTNSFSLVEEECASTPCSLTMTSKIDRSFYDSSVMSKLRGVMGHFDGKFRSLKWFGI